MVEEWPRGVVGVVAIVKLAGIEKRGGQYNRPQLPLTDFNDSVMFVSNGNLSARVYPHVLIFVPFNHVHKACEIVPSHNNQSS